MIVIFRWGLECGVYLDLLFLVLSCGFERERLEKASRHIRLKLRRRSIYANHNLEIEVVPFETLVEAVMGMMDVGRRKKIAFKSTAVV